MHSYGVREVEKLLGLSRSTVRALITAGFVAPARGPRNAWQFSFQDLILLRAAQALTTAKVPQRRIMRALKRLRERLPESMPMSGWSIAALADQVVVREGDRRWQAESGQYVLALEGEMPAGSSHVLEATTPAPSPSAAEDEGDDWFEEALMLEHIDRNAARRAYERAIAADPTRLAARVNLGRLLHEAGHLTLAERVYRDAAATGATDALLHYNFAVLLEDLNRKPDAIRAYEAALRDDPQLADAHYNLALLCEELGQPKDAIRHMAQYRRLSKP